MTGHVNSNQLKSGLLARHIVGETEDSFNSQDLRMLSKFLLDKPEKQKKENKERISSN